MWEKQTILYCSLYDTLRCTFCSEHTETPLEATAISMREAKEDLVSDLIQAKSMCTHLLLIVPISSRRDTVLEFQGYPCCLCLGKTLEICWEPHLNASQECGRGVGVTKPWLLLAGFSTWFWEKSHKDCIPQVCLPQKRSYCQSVTSERCWEA